MKISLIGDVHGKISSYLKIIAEHERTIQLGDLGVGLTEETIPQLPANHAFIRGNHDNPELCRQMPNYLGDFGYATDESIFFVSGAFSIDRRWRIEGQTWWRDEELGLYTLEQMIEEFDRVKPRFMLTHECPQSIIGHLHSHHMFDKTRTAQALDAAFSLHQPEAWFFGHHHVSWSQTIQGTHFQCLNELEVCEIDV
jgi:predicted phosphodiesterase